MIRHIWFDLAGTLYREPPAFTIAHDKHLYQTYANIVGEPDLVRAKHSYDALLGIHGSNSAVFRSLGMSSDFWHKNFEKLDISALLKPNFEINSTLSEIKKLVPISLFTNIKPQTIKKVLAQLQIPITTFTHILSGDDIAERKPHLEGFHKMVELTKLPADQLMYVGDRLDVDIKPAKSVGMCTCLVWTTSTDADYNVSDFSELTEVVRLAIS